MTQPAKVQEPSMEEILASIRRIIADDEAKPPAADRPSGGPPAPPPTAVKPEKPAAMPPAPKIPETVAKAAPPPPEPAAPPAATNSQDDIDALLNGLDEATTAEEIRPPQPNGEVCELTDEMAVPSVTPSRPSFRRVEPEDDLEFPESVAARNSQRAPAYDPPPAPMLSHSTVAAVESAFNTLAHTVLSNNARTLEDLVKEMLRPMLKAWLDDNLPGLVERIVKAEIERVSRGR